MASYHWPADALHACTLEGVKVVGVIDLDNEAGQASELPRPELYGNLCREPRLEVASVEVARGFLAMVAADGGRVLCQRPLLVGIVLVVIALVLRQALAAVCPYRPVLGS